MTGYGNEALPSSSETVVVLVWIASLKCHTQIRKYRYVYLSVFYK